MISRCYFHSNRPLSPTHFNDTYIALPYRDRVLLLLILKELRSPQAKIAGTWNLSRFDAWGHIYWSSAEEIGDN